MKKINLRYIVNNYATKLYSNSKPDMFKIISDICMYNPSKMIRTTTAIYIHKYKLIMLYGATIIM